MPSSFDGNPLAALSPGGGMPPMGMNGGMMTGAPDPSAGGGGDPSGGMPPGLANMSAAAQLAPQVFGQQNSQYYKLVLKQLISLIREMMRSRGIDAKTISTLGRGVTALEAAGHQLDKQNQDMGPVQSLLAASLMQQQMGASPGGPPAQSQLPIMTG